MTWEPPITFDHPKLPEFATDVLPQWLRTFVEAASQSIQVAPDLPGMLSLGTLATAAQGQYRVQIKRGYAEPLNLYLACSLPPGCRKSSIFSLATKPVADFEQEHAQHAQRKLKQHQTECRVLKQAIRFAESQAAKTLNDEERERWLSRAQHLDAELESIGNVTAPRMLADDVTPQKLVSLLDAHKRIAVLSSEAGIFSNMAAQATMDVYLKAWAGETIAVDRKSCPGM